MKGFPRLGLAMCVVCVCLGARSSRGQEVPIAPAVKQPPNGNQQGRLIKRVDPVYPNAAGTDILDGDVVLKVTIRADGTVKVNKVTHGLPLLIPAAVHAVSQWLYEPSRINGVAIPIETSITIHFKALPVDGQKPDSLVGGQMMGALQRTPLPPPPEGVMRISSRVMGTMLQKRVDPAYPPDSIALNAQGTVVVLATVDKTGAVTEVEVISGPERFRDAATDAVKQWRYSPYLVEGVSVEVQTIVSLDFLPPR